MSEASSVANSPSGETKAQEQARLRRERRNKKLQEGGSDRLGKITSLSGRPAAAEAELAKSSSPQSTAGQPTADRKANVSKGDDPEEVDISTMFQRPTGDATATNQQDLFRQMLAATGTPPAQQRSGTATPQMSDADDPMVRMMQQMLGGMGMEGAGGPNSGIPENLPQGLASMFGGETQNIPQHNADYLWRIVHGVFSVCLGLYAAMAFPTFSGSELERSSSSISSVEPRVFWIFATVELVLQSTRYFVDGGKLPSSGILGGLGQMLPPPYAHYVRVIGRYSIICTTIASDALAIVFVLGCMAWWSGFAPS